MGHGERRRPVGSRRFAKEVASTFSIGPDRAMRMRFEPSHPNPTRAALLLLSGLAACTQSAPEPPAGKTGAPAEAARADKGTRPSTRDQVDSDGVVRRGEPLGDAERWPVDEVIARASELDGQTLAITGEVGAVCSKKGCWMSLEGEGDRQIRVTFEDYGFFVPKKSPGMRAVVEGRFAVKTLDVEKAQHLENDRVEGTAEAPQKITEPKRELTLVARGLELRPI